MIADKLVSWAALFIAVSANIGANIALKMAVTSVTERPDKRIFPHILEENSFWIGLCLAGVLFVAYLFAIRQIPVSAAYIIVTSLAMVGLLAAESVMFGLPLSLAKVAGVAFIVTGVLLIATGG